MPTAFLPVVDGDDEIALQVEQYRLPVRNLESGLPWWAGLTSGSGTAYTASVAPAPGTLVAGNRCTIYPHVANSGACTLDLNGGGAVEIRARGLALVAGQIPASVPLSLVYDGTYWQATGAGLVAGDLPAHSAGLLTSGTVDTARLGSGTATSAKYLRGNQSWATLDTSALGDFTITSAADLDLLQYDSASSKWTNRTFLKADLITSKGATVLTMRPGTTGGSDSAAAQIWGGSGASAATGAGAVFYGLNAGGNAGRVVVKPATSAGFIQLFDSAGAEQLRVDANGLNLLADGSASGTAYQIFRTSVVFGRNTPTGTTYVDYIAGSPVSQVSAVGIYSIGGVFAPIGNSTIAVLRPNTADGTDNQYAALYGGGGSGNTRGAVIKCFGNENGSVGAISLVPGEINGRVYISDSSGASHLQIDTVGLSWLIDGSVVGNRYHIYRTATSFARNCPAGIAYSDYINGVLASQTTVSGIFSATGVFSSVFNSTPTVVRANTADATDNQSACLVGGGALALSRGGFIIAYGNENAAAGDCRYNTGDPAAAAHRFYDPNNAEQIKISVNGLKWGTNGTLQSAEYQDGRTSTQRFRNVPTSTGYGDYINGAQVWGLTATAATNSTNVYQGSASGLVQLRPSTSAATDNQGAILSGAGNGGVARGAQIAVFGLDYSGSFAGTVTINPATGAGAVRIYDNAGSETVRVDVNTLQLWDGKNLATGTVTGSKIFAASNQKGGFWGATPVVQQTGPTALSSRTAAGTYGATEQTMVQEAHDTARLALALIRTIGLAA